MKDVLLIEELDQAKALLKPRRIEILRRLGEPQTLANLAEMLAETPQKLHYHVKALERAGLVDRVGERSEGGRPEGVYRARAATYWLAPRLVGKVGGPKPARNQVSLRVLLGLAEEIQQDVGRLSQQTEAGQDVASLSLSAHIYLPDGERRSEFLAEVQATFQALARKYGLPAAEPAAPAGSFRLVLACYPKEA